MLHGTERDTLRQNVNFLFSFSVPIKVTHAGTISLKGREGAKIEGGVTFGQDSKGEVSHLSQQHCMPSLC